MCVLVRFLYYCGKTLWPKPTWGGVYLAYSSQSIIKESQGKNLCKAEALGTGTAAETPKEHCSLACSPGLCSTRFLMQARTTSLLRGGSNPQWAESFHINEQLRKYLDDMPTASLVEIIPQFEVPSSQATPVCVKLTKNKLT